VALRLRSKLVTAYPSISIFSPTKILNVLLASCATLPSRTQPRSLINNTDELTVLVDDVKVTFLKYPFPTFDPFVIHEQAPLLSVREIAATKAYTIGRRGAYRITSISISSYRSNTPRSPTSSMLRRKKFGVAPVSGADRISRRRGRYRHPVSQNRSHAIGMIAAY
jgi:hypothetical protein